MDTFGYEWIFKFGHEWIFLDTFEQFEYQLVWFPISAAFQLVRLSISAAFHV